MKNYLQFNREEWQSLSATEPVKITQDELAKIKSLGDIINLTDVQEVYGSLIKYLYLVYQEKRALQQKQGNFLHQKVASAPFIIGISGSVAVGKSTTARLLQILLSRSYPGLKVHLMTTDGFIYSNQELTRRNLTDRKGFPESYNMNLLINFLQDVLSGKKDIVYPLYSQELSDIVPGKYGHVCEPDILIIEGINTLQLPTNGQIVTSDFFDSSIYIDNPHNFYYEMANGPRDEALRIAQETWQMVNLVNLREYIAPTKPRASLILHKTAGHVIDKIYLKQI